MVLVDTSIWIDHLRSANTRMARLLEDGEIVVHPFVIGELACGNLRNRSEILALLHALPQAPCVTDSEVLFFIERHSLAGQGLGLIDMHLLASSQTGCAYAVDQRPAAESSGGRAWLGTRPDMNSGRFDADSEDILFCGDVNLGVDRGWKVFSACFPRARKLIWQRGTSKAPQHEEIRSRSWLFTISFYNDFIFAAEDFPHLGLPLNLHPSLPRLRGVGHDCIPLIENHGEHGGTLHYMEPPVREGPRVARAWTPAGSSESASAP